MTDTETDANKTGEHDDGDFDPEVLAALKGDETLKPGEEEGAEDSPNETTPATAGGDEEYSARVQKRINKEVSKRKVMEDNFKRKEDAYEKEVKDLRAANAKVSDEGLEAKEKDLRAQMKVASDEEDWDEFNTLNSRLVDVRIDRRLVSAKPEPPPHEVQPPQQQQTAPAAQAWIDGNQSWFESDPGKLLRAQNLEKQLLREGYDTTDPGLYEELDLRIGGGGTRRETSPPRTNAGMPHRGGGSDSAGKPRFTKDDVVNMRTFGYDPNSPKDRKTWLDRDKPLY